MTIRAIRASVVAASAIASLALAGAASAQQVWQVQTSMTAGESYYVDIEQHWLPVLKEMTEGQLEIQLTPVGSVVPHNETMDAINMGILQGDITATVYFAGRNKVFSLLGDLIAGYDTPDQIGMFCYHGGGRELLQEAFDQYAGNVQVIGCGSIARESFTSTVPVRGFDDLAGLKIRSPEGLAAEVFSRAGASPVALPAAETYTSLEKRVVDAADFSSYTMDKSVGMHEVAKYPIYPGIHSMPVIQFTVNKELYEALPPHHQVALDVWYRAMISDMQMRNDMSDRMLIADDRANPDRGIEIVDWPQEERDRLRQVAQEAWKDFAAGDDLSTRAYEAHVEFMQKIGLL
jgi:TRAP-type mannitol/chloroaromatic compound transport system substrate-binding protein